MHREVIASHATPAARAVVRLTACARLRARVARRCWPAIWRRTARRCRPTATLQAALHPSLVSDVAARVIDVARAHGAAGWKVNGAGGDGGSVTVMCGAGPGARAHLAPAIERQVPGVRVLHLQLSTTGVEFGIPT